MQIIAWGNKGGLENNLKNWSKKLNWWKCNNLLLLYPILAVDKISLKIVT